MSRIESVFSSGRKALIGYVTAGFPSLDITPAVCRLLAECGCDIIELGIPFSDPLGDGPTIQQTSFQALQQGATPRYCLEVARTIRKQIDTPLVFMTYYNPVLNFGIDDFCSECHSSGIDGLIIPDAPPEECVPLEGSASHYSIDVIYLLTPTTTPARIKLITDRSSGFIYLVSVAGVTGARTTLPENLESFVSNVRAVTSKPLCVGFGISTPEQAHQVASFSDGIIVGSQIIRTIEQDPSLKATRKLITSLRNALDT